MGELKKEEKEKTFISAVIYLHNDGRTAIEFLNVIQPVLEQNFEDYELIAVDDSCTDDTLSGIKEWAVGKDAPLTILHMSLYHGVEDAMNAGIDVAIGDFIFEFDSTQMPYDKSLIMDAYRNSLEGNDIVCVCPDRVKGSSRLFYRIFNANSGSVYKLHTDAFRLVTRRAINRVHASHAYMPYRKAAYAASGLKMSSLSFDGKVSNNQRSRLSLAINSLALYTNAGYRISIGFTVFMMAVTLVELIYTLVIYFMGIPIVGWTTTILVISFGFLGLFFSQSIIIKYLSLNLDMSFRKQKYLIESIEKIQK